MRNMSVVTTTISDGAFLASVAAATVQHGSMDRIVVYVVGDINTNCRCKEECRRWNAEGFDFRYVDVDEQEEFLRQFPILKDAIPFRSDNRRNVGYLMALRDGGDILISIDDDNLPIAGSPFFENHAQVGLELELKEVAGKRSWFNVGCLLDTKTARGEALTIYPRGFPYRERMIDHSSVCGQEVTGICGANLGLWLGDPDVDAPTRLTTRCVSSMKDDCAYFVAGGQRTPISSQNCAFVREATCAAYYWRMGSSQGIRMGRYGDMFGGYCMQLCLEAAGYRLRVGSPFVEQRRNEHDLMGDLLQEIPGMVILEDLCRVLEQPLSRTRDMGAAYLELSDVLLSWAKIKKTRVLWELELESYFTEIAEVMHAWVEACAELER